MAGLMKVQCVFVGVMVVLASVVLGLRPGNFMVAEMQQNDPQLKGYKVQLLPKERKAIERTTRMGFTHPKKVNTPLTFMESARTVPTGPDPLHHNGSPVKPAFP